MSASEHGMSTGLRIPSCGVRLLDTEPRATLSNGELQRSPTLGQATDGERSRRVSSVSSSVPPRVDRGVLRGFLFAAVFFVPFWLLVVYAAVRGVW